MNIYIYLQLFIFIVSTITVVINGYFMLLEKDKLEFKELTKSERIYTISLIYNEIYLGLYIIYTFIYLLYYIFINCISNKSIEITFSLWKAIYLFSGIISHIYSTYILLFNPNYIDQNIQTININFTANIILCILSVIITKIISFYKKDVSYQELLL
jgi:hypothetical protein